MTNVEKKLFTFTASVVSKKNIDIPPISEAEMSELYNLSKGHDIAHIVAAALIKNKLLPDSEIGKKFRKQVTLAIFRYERLSAEAESVCRLFEENKIAHMPLKGAVLKEYYPEPWMRTSCDVDILVKKEDMQHAADLLCEKLGYTLEEKGSHDWGFRTPDGFHIELHFDLIEQEVASDGVMDYNWNIDCLENVWEEALPDTDGGYGYHMSDSMFYLYHIAHMAKHFERGGCGVRAFLDVFILNNFVEAKSEDRARLLSGCGLERFEESARRVADVWLGKSEPDKTTELLTEYVLNGGTYGNGENLSAVKQNKKGGKIRYYLSMIFLPYESMKLQYKVLEKHKWLLPVCYIRRIFRTIFLRSDRIAESLKNNNLSDEKLTKTNELFRRIGL